MKSRFVVLILVLMALFVGICMAQDLTPALCPLTPSPEPTQEFGVTSITNQVAGQCVGNVFATENIFAHQIGDYHALSGSNYYVATGLGASQFAMQSTISNTNTTSIQTTRALDYYGAGASLEDNSFIAQMGATIPQLGENETNATALAPALNNFAESKNYGIFSSGAYGSQEFILNAPGTEMRLDYQGAIDKPIAIPASDAAIGMFTFSESVAEQTGRVTNTSSTVPVNVTDATGNVTTVNQTTYQNEMILDSVFNYDASTTMIGKFILGNQFNYHWITQ